jgi:hypothetical protein
MTLASALSPPAQNAPAQICRVNRITSAEVRLLNIPFSTLYNSFRHFSTALGSFDTLRHFSTGAVHLSRQIAGAKSLTDGDKGCADPDGCRASPHGAPLLARQENGLHYSPNGRLSHVNSYRDPVPRARTRKLLPVAVVLLEDFFARHLRGNSASSRCRANFGPTSVHNQIGAARRG